MSQEMLQMLYYVGFVVLGWFLRHKGVLKPTDTPPSAPSDLTDLLKALLERLSRGDEEVKR